MNFVKTGLIYLLIIPLLMNISCSSLIGRIAGYKPPYFETDEGLSRYMFKNAIDSNLTYVGIDSLSVLKLINLEAAKGKILTFNKNGDLQKYVEKSTCPGPVENYLNGICDRASLISDSAISLDKIIPLLKPIVRNNDLKITEHPDLTFIIFWTIYYGKNNKDLNNWYAVIKDQKKHCNIKVLFVNNDFKASYYGLSRRKKVPVIYNVEIPN